MSSTVVQEEKPAPPPVEAAATPKTVGYIAVAVNMVSSIFLVIVNKWLFQQEKWQFSVGILLLHAASTKLMLLILRWCGVFPTAECSQREVFKLAAAAVISLALMNLNLLHNSVGTFQLSKLLVIPATVIIQRIWYGVTPSVTVIFSLILLMIGVGVATWTDVSATPFGLIIAFFAIITSAISSLLIGAKQKELGLSPLQLIDQQLFQVLFLLGLTIPFIENIRAMIDFAYTGKTIGILLGSAVLAGGLNISGYFVIGVLSALTYHVSTHFKTISTLGLGMLLLGEIASIWRWVGILVGISGTAIYAVSKDSSSSFNFSIPQTKSIVLVVVPLITIVLAGGGMLRYYDSIFQDYDATYEVGMSPSTILASSPLSS